MKRRILFVLMAVSVLSLTACASSPADTSSIETDASLNPVTTESESTMTARVIGVTEGCVYIEPTDGSYANHKFVLVSQGLSTDDIVEITYSGEIDENYPETLDGITSVKKAGHVKGSD